MNEFRLLNRSRQITDYSCGASALQAVLSHWGTDVDERELMKLLGTSEEIGTNPEDIARGAKALGLSARVAENLTLDEVREFTSAGKPMIALAQVWRSQSKSPILPTEDWDNGHYIVVLSVDDDYVYFQDPFARMSKAFVPRKSFEDHWHQVMGGDMAKNRKLMHLGIFVEGSGKPKPKAAEEDPSLESVDFRRLGSLNLVVMEFSGFLLPYDFLNELKDIWHHQDIRPNAFIFLRKDAGGQISGMEGSRLTDDEDIVATNAVIAAITSRSIGAPETAKAKAGSAVGDALAGDFGLSAGDVRRIADKLSNNRSAVIVLFENVWERRLRDTAERYGGKITSQRLISPESLAAAARNLTA